MINRKKQISVHHKDMDTKQYVYSFSRRYWKYLLLAIIVCTAGMYQCNHNNTSQGNPRDFAEIKKSGSLHVVTEYNSIGYYMEGDSVAGFQYELAKAFAESQGIQVRITPEMSFTRSLEGLEDGQFDLIACNIPTTTEQKDSISLTTPILLNKLVLVQRKPTSRQDSAYISSQLQLAGKTIHISQHSPFVFRIRHLSEEIGDTIYVKEIARYGAEQLMAMVAHGDIDYMVCDEATARAQLEQMPQLDIQTPVSFTLFYSWAVSKQSPALLDTLNQWLEGFKKTDPYRRICKKYYPQSAIPQTTSPKQ